MADSRTLRINRLEIVIQNTYFEAIVAVCKMLNCIAAPSTERRVNIILEYNNNLTQFNCTILCYNRHSIVYVHYKIQVVSKGISSFGLLY